MESVIRSHYSDRAFLVYDHSRSLNRTNLYELIKTGPL
jgi:hypothetical protein